MLYGFRVLLYQYFIHVSSLSLSIYMYLVHIMQVRLAEDIDLCRQTFPSSGFRSAPSPAAIQCSWLPASPVGPQSFGVFCSPVGVLGVLGHRIGRMRRGISLTCL